MLQDRVRQLKVHVRACQGYRPGTQADAERITRSVLERVAARLEADDPQRIVFIRELSLRWRVHEKQLTESAIAEKYAHDIHARLRDEAPLGLDIHSSDVAKDVAVFIDEGHWRAAHLLASSRNGKGHAWFFKNLEAEGDPLDVLAASHRRPLAWQVLELLASQGRLTDVIRAAPPEKLRALAQALLANEKVDGESHFTRLPSVPPSITGRLAAAAKSLPGDLSRSVVVMVLHAYARAMPGSTPHEVASIVNKCLLQLEGEGASKDVALYPDARQTAPDSGQPAIQTADAAGVAQSLEQAGYTAEEEPEAFTEESVVVAAGGLFYLLNCALELNLGEILWKACLSEQQVFAHALAALLGEGLSNDAAIRLFAGCRPAPNEPQISEAQLAEVTEEFLAALTAALPRRGLATFPETVVGLGLHHKEHLLVARPADSPFVLFVRPTPTPETACKALEAFLAGWPRSAPAPSASPAIAELDRTGRIRPLYRDPKPIAPLLPEAGFATATALFAQTIGVMCHLMEARARGKRLATSAEFVEHFLRLSATVRVTPEYLRVVTPAERVDIQLRRAGLDRDPGWVSWLQKTVRFEFEEGCERPVDENDL